LAISSAVGPAWLAGMGIGVDPSKWSHFPLAFMADEKWNSKISQLTLEGLSFRTSLGRELVSVVTVVDISSLVLRLEEPRAHNLLDVLRLVNTTED